MFSAGHDKQCSKTRSQVRLEDTEAESRVSMSIIHFWWKFWQTPFSRSDLMIAVDQIVVELDSL